VYALKKHLKQEFEDTLTNQVPNLGYEPNLARVKIADIQFSFKNGVLINGLKTRGLHIKNNNWVGVKKQNEALD
jgi:hypothetical protein